MESVLNRLSGVKKTGNGKYIACCPAHDDKHASLSIGIGQTGNVLLHCFAGCEYQNVLEAAGLSSADIYPERIKPFNKTQRSRPPFSAMDALRCINFETLLVAVAAGNIAQGIALTDTDRARLLAAAARINKALEVVANGNT